MRIDFQNTETGSLVTAPQAQPREATAEPAPPLSFDIPRRMLRQLVLAAERLSMTQPAASPTSIQFSASPTLAIPLNPLISRLQQHVLPVAPSHSQASLPFPPEAVRSKA